MEKNKGVKEIPVLTDESESKKSSFLSWHIWDEVFCWSTVAAIWGFFWCWRKSKVSSLSSHWDTLSNLSNFDDSSISTFFTINFVVLLLVSILAICRSWSGQNIPTNFEYLIKFLIFPNFCVLNQEENKYTECESNKKKKRIRVEEPLKYSSYKNKYVVMVMISKEISPTTDYES